MTSGHSDGRSRQLDHCPKHEKSDAHQSVLRYREETSRYQQSPHPPVPSETDLTEDALRNLLASFAGPFALPYPMADQQGLSPPHSAGIDWHLFEANEITDLAQSAEQRGVALITQGFLERLDELSMSSMADLEERSEIDQAESQEPVVAVDDVNDHLLEQPRKRTRLNDPQETSHHWNPWPDKISCTLDILMHLPRSVFSHRQLDLFLWLLKVNNVNDVPSVKAMQNINAASWRTIAMRGKELQRDLVGGLCRCCSMLRLNLHGPCLDA